MYTIKTPGVALAVAGMILAVVALAMFGRVVNSTKELVRLLHISNPPAATGASGIADADALDALPLSIDAALESVPTAVPPAELRPSAQRRLDGGGYDQAISNGGDVSAVLDDGAGAPPAPAPAAAAIIVVDAATEAGPNDARAGESSTKSAPEAAPVRCGSRICPKGQECCNWACSICVSPGETCSISCGMPSAPISAPCGPNTCNVSEVCCNASCGICVAAGDTCSKKPCPGIYLPVSPTCGMNTCNAGQVCCNPSCGICTNPGETCSLEPCR
jgi:hypothetical protein